MLVLLGGPALSAELDPFDDSDRVGSHEVWGGVDVFQRAWFSYAGLTVAPWGDTHTDGWRLRAIAGAGRYTSQINDQPAGLRAIEHDKATGEILAGYQFQVDTLTIKAFAGWAMLARRQLGSNTDPRINHGLKVVAELWLDWTETTFASLDLAYADTRSALDMRLRIGERVETQVSVGVEALFNRLDISDEATPAPAGSSTGNAVLGTGRGGVFVRYDWFGGEASLSGGITFDASTSSQGIPILPSEIGGYGAAVLLFQF